MLGMSQVKANRNADNVQFSVENGHTSAPAMNFQAHIGAQRQTNVVALDALQAKLPTFNTCKLLERPMIHFHQPSTISQEVALRLSHTQATSGPVVRVAVWVNRPKYFDHAIAAQVNRQARHRDIQLALFKSIIWRLIETPLVILQVCSGSLKSFSLRVAVKLYRQQICILRGRLIRRRGG
jgi:hypothetical protein